MVSFRREKKRRSMKENGVAGEARAEERALDSRRDSCHRSSSRQPESGTGRRGGRERRRRSAFFAQAQLRGTVGGESACSRAEIDGRAVALRAVARTVAARDGRNAPAP